jgi:hypothetical protein
MKAMKPAVPPAVSYRDRRCRQRRRLKLPEQCTRHFSERSSGDTKTLWVPKMPFESFRPEFHQIDEFNFDSAFVNSDNSASRSLGQTNLRQIRPSFRDGPFGLLEFVPDAEDAAITAMVKVKDAATKAAKKKGTRAKSGMSESGKK